MRLLARLRRKRGYHTSIVVDGDARFLAEAKRTGYIGVSRTGEVMRVTRVEPERLIFQAGLPVDKEPARMYVIRGG